MAKATFPTELDRKARDWVQSNHENFGYWGEWEASDYWFYIEEVYTGGREAFEANNR